MKSEAEIYEAVARGWCHDANSAKEMDVLLGEAIAIEVLKVIRPLVAERDALAAENERLRAALLEADNLIGVVVEDFSTEIRQHGDQLIDALEAFHREHYIPALAALEGGEAPDA